MAHRHLCLPTWPILIRIGLETMPRRPSSTKGPGRPTAVQTWFALWSAVEAVGDVAGERLVLRQIAKLLEIRLHPRILAKGVDILAVSPLRIHEDLSAVPALDEVGRDPPRHLVEHGRYALLEE